MANPGNDMQLQLPSLTGIKDALRLIRPFLPETPIVRSELLSRLLGADVWLKNETVSPIACFKLRGALTELLRAKPRGPVTAVVTSSTGNHGQGVAYAARLNGTPAHIFLPVRPNPIKRGMIEAIGGTIHEGGRDIDEAKELAKTFTGEYGYCFIDDGESPGVIEGAGTVGLEIAQSLDAIDWLIVPMGSGSLASGCAAALKALQHNARVLAVQSEGSSAMVESFFAKRAVSKPVETIADGLVCREPAMLALNALWNFADDATVVTDEEILAAVHTLVSAAHVLVEPSGAAPLAAAWKRRTALAGKRIVLLLTGANITTEMLQRALATPQLRAGKNSSQ
jgi:threonine dehydratase